MPCMQCNTVEPPIKDPLRKGQDTPFAIANFMTSEKRTTSEIRTEAVYPKCTLFGGSTVAVTCSSIYIFVHDKQDAAIFNLIKLQ